MARERLKTFLREWRQHRGLSIEAAAAELGTTGASLSRIERGLQPYNQDQLENMALLYGCDPAELLVRNPHRSATIYSIWDHATESEKHQIERLAEAITGYRPGTER